MDFTTEHELWLGYVKRYMDQMEAVGRLLQDFPDVIKIRTLKLGTIYEAKAAIAKKWVNRYWECELHILTADALSEQSLEDVVLAYDWGAAVLEEFGHLLPSPEESLEAESQRYWIKREEALGRRICW
ncbi:hypothetical protein MMC30_004609 [Trapelia coarctata]|nr:hypothetical protein [Trapelia coarctata]